MANIVRINERQRAADALPLRVPMPVPSQARRRGDLSRETAQRDGRIPRSAPRLPTQHFGQCRQREEVLAPFVIGFGSLCRLR